MYFSLPLVIYELVNIIRQTKRTKKCSDIILFIGDLLSIAVILYRYVNQTQNEFNVVILLISTIAVILNVYSNKVTELKHQLIVERDSSKELTIALKQKNHYLIEKQDAEINMAKLKERNRIAREIHDNVGHMLSRSILLTGAMTAVNQDESLKPMVKSLQDTLNGAMDNIRQSVHDLHDESIDLKSAVEELLQELKDYNVNFDYDMGSEIPRNIKYCFISIVKEAVTNIIKHSDATRVDVILVEHPSFYQLQVNDNGKCIKEGDGSGIGLQNIRDRVESFHGNLNITSERGYKIFVNIPKEEHKQ